MELKSIELPTQVKTKERFEAGPLESSVELEKLSHPKLTELKLLRKETQEQSSEVQERKNGIGSSLQLAAIVLRHYNQILGHLNRSGFLLDLEFGKISKNAATYLQRGVNKNIRAAGALGIGIGAIAEIVKNPSLRGVVKAGTASAVAGFIFLATPLAITGSATLGTSLAVGIGIAVGTQLAWTASVRLVDFFFDNINSGDKKEKTKNINRRKVST